MNEISKWVAGVDPGLEGGITFLSDDGEVRSFVMPTMKAKKRMIDATGIRELIQAIRPRIIAIEQVSSRPLQGVVSMYSFGYSAGIVEGVALGMKIGVVMVRPQEWMGSILKGLPKDDSKSSIVFCRRMWPNVDWRKSDRATNFHDGKSDSAAIALWARSFLNGESTPSGGTEVP